MPKPGIAWPGPLLRLKSIDSTQDLARRMAENGAADRTLIIAERQTKGRGRVKRRWASSEGGIYLSAIFRPRVSPRRLGELSLSVAAAAARAASEVSGLETMVKPPNDVLARPRAAAPWKKICGILIEASGDSTTTEWVIVGLGMNVNNTVSRQLTRAASLKSLTEKSYELHEVAGRLLSELSSAYKKFAS